MNLDLNLNPYPSLLRVFLAKSFRTLFRKKLASLFGSMFASMLV